MKQRSVAPVALVFTAALAVALKSAASVDETALTPLRPVATGDHAHTGVSAVVVTHGPEIVWIPAGQFMMGASDEDLAHAQYLCQRDVPEEAPDYGLSWRCAGLLDSMEGIALGPLCDRSNFVYVTYREEGQHAVFLSEYGIDRTEVSVRDYWRCVNDGACSSIRLQEGSVPFGISDHPVVGVSWHQAREYCRWQHGHLPTEAQWERAARGRDGRVFPWGNQFNPHIANVGMTSASCLSDADGYLYTSPVQALPGGHSPDGVLNMAGNAAEWVDDAFDEGPEDPVSHRPQWRLSRSKYQRDVTAINPHVTEARDDRRVFRGGSYASQSFQARTSFRARIAAGEQTQWLGFRCAYDR